MGTKIRIGVIGLGFGKQHIRTFNAHPRSVVTAVCGTDAGRARQIAEAFGVPHAYGDYRKMLDEAPIDAVVIITPPAQHVPMSLAAIEAGKHVFCAKPLALTLADARMLLQRARESGLVHAIDLQLRYTDTALTIKKLVDDGAIGRPLSLVNAFGLYLPEYFANPNASPNKNDWFARRDRSGGLFLANAPHEFDRLLWWFGPVRSVSGRAHVAMPEVVRPDGQVVQCDADDSYHALLEFESGLMALTQCTPVAWPGRFSRFEVHGDRGSLVLDGRGAGEGLRLAGPTSPDFIEVPLVTDPDVPTAPDGVQGIFLALYRIVDRFLRAILDGTPMSPSFDDACRMQEIIEAVIRSGQTGQRQDLPLA